MMSSEANDGQPGSEHSASGRGTVRVDVSTGATSAAGAAGGPGRIPLAGFFAMLDRAAAAESSLRTRLCLLTAFSRAADQACIDQSAPAGDQVHQLVARHSAIFHGVVAPALVSHQLAVVAWQDLESAVRAQLS